MLQFGQSVLLLPDVPEQAASGEGAVGKFVLSHVLASSECLGLRDQLWWCLSDEVRAVRDIPAVVDGLASLVLVKDVIQDE